ncbi:hypothetical protein [Micromonospora sp. WMMD1219]|uniref:hypothetical protein n=1 Tax=Micromonospora sp. WMMD1219 TaxID=3404115 RepID=UPI003BF60DEB
MKQLVRKELIIARDAIVSLRFPSVSLADGGPAEVVQVRSWRASLFRRSVALALPFDSDSAERIRRGTKVQRLEALLIGPARLVVVGLGAVTLVGTWLDLSFSPLPFVFVFAALALQALAHHLNTRALPPQYPRERKDGSLLIREVPDHVAQEWTEVNPGVQIAPVS